MAGLYRRGKVWWGRAQRGGREHRRSLQTANRAIAEKRLAQWLGDLQAVAWGDKPRRSFAEAAARFIHEHLTTLKPGGAKRYGVSLKTLAPHFGGKTLDQIRSAELAAFEAARRGDGVAPGTIRRDLACLSSLMTSATDWEWIVDGCNPVPSYMRRRAKRGLKEAPPRTRYLTEAEEQALLSAATAAPRAAMILAIDTGLRREELFSLTWAQVDMARGLISTTTLTKSGRMRKVPISTRSAQNLAQQVRYLESPYVLVNPDTRERYVQMDKGLKAAARRAKIEDFRWHDLRRTSGCRWLQRDGKSMAEVSLLLGHSSVTVTEQRYAFLEAEAVAQSLSGPHKSRHMAKRTRREKSDISK
ncbi:MAG: tyrosine-type recombinase/integrase [Rhizobiales bacterium]|nr:tyrosine-type recombinase/integrase [Hyphomicrobiales bacterium]